jgi:hypothetical protein
MNRATLSITMCYGGVYIHVQVPDTVLAIKEVLFPSRAPPLERGTWRGASSRHTSFACKASASSDLRCRTSAWLPAAALLISCRRTLRDLTAACVHNPQIHQGSVDATCSTATTARSQCGILCCQNWALAVKPHELLCTCLSDSGHETRARADSVIFNLEAQRSAAYLMDRC